MFGLHQKCNNRKKLSLFMCMFCDVRFKTVQVKKNFIFSLDLASNAYHISLSNLCFVFVLSRSMIVLMLTKAITVLILSFNF